MYTADEVKNLSIHAIARIIRQDWAKVNFAAAPYLDAMGTMQSANDSYGMDDGHMIIAYFLGNAGAYRGEQARIIKAELKRRLK